MGLFGGNKQEISIKLNKKVEKILVNGDTFESITQYGNLYLGKNHIYVDTMLIDATKKITDQDNLHETYRIRKDKIQSLFIEQKETKIMPLCNLCIVTSGKVYRVLFNNSDVYEAYNALEIL